MIRSVCGGRVLLLWLLLLMMLLLMLTLLLGFQVLLEQSQVLWGELRKRMNRICLNLFSYRGPNSMNIGIIIHILSRFSSL